MNRSSADSPRRRTNWRAEAWKLVYNTLLCVLFPPFLFVAIAKPKIRKTFVERLLGRTRDYGLKDAFWIHAASVGEAMIAQNLIAFMRKSGYAGPFLVTTNTHYTRDLLRSRMGDSLVVCSMPFDLSYCLKRFMKGSTFRALIIVETEIWPNLIWLSHKKGIPVFIINGRISDKTLSSYRKFSFFLKELFPSVEAVLAQSEEQRSRFTSIGMAGDRVFNTGNLKYYRDISGTTDKTARMNWVTFGSIKEKEVEPIAQVARRLKEHSPGLTVFVAPRELRLTGSIEAALSQSLRTVRYSEYRNDPSHQWDVVIVDTVGDLLEIYRQSLLAFVGGSLAPYGGQNMLEPLFFGTPVVFGPHVENFRDIAAEILKEDAGIVVADGDELYAAMEQLLDDENLRRRMGEAANRVVNMQKTAMERTVSIIMSSIDRGLGMEEA